MMDLLAAEITATTGKDPGQHYQALTESSVAALHARRRAGHAGAEEPSQQALAGAGARRHAGRRADHAEAHPRARQQRRDRRPEGVAENGWFAARPSGTEDSTRSTPRASRIRPTSTPSSPRARQIVDAAMRGYDCGAEDTHPAPDPPITRRGSRGTPRSSRNSCYHGGSASVGTRKSPAADNPRALGRRAPGPPPRAACRRLRPFPHGDGRGEHQQAGYSQMREANQWVLAGERRHGSEPQPEPSPEPRKCPAGPDQHIAFHRCTLPSTHILSCNAHNLARAERLILDSCLQIHG